MNIIRHRKATSNIISLNWEKGEWQSREVKRYATFVFNGYELHVTQHCNREELKVVTDPRSGCAVHIGGCIGKTVDQAIENFQVFIDTPSRGVEAIIKESLEFPPVSTRPTWSIL